MTYSIPTTFIGRAYTTSIPTTVVGIDIPTKLVGTVYFDKSCPPHYLLEISSPSIDHNLCDINEPPDAESTHNYVNFEA